jgi:hypothetical protein
MTAERVSQNSMETLRISSFWWYPKLYGAKSDAQSKEYCITTAFRQIGGLPILPIGTFRVRRQERQELGSKYHPLVVRATWFRSLGAADRLTVERLRLDHRQVASIYVAYGIPLLLATWFAFRVIAGFLGVLSVLQQR